MKKKVYRILSWKNKRLVIGVFVYIIPLIMISINLFSSPDGNLEESYYVIGIFVLLFLVFLYITYKIRCEVNSEGITHYSFFHKVQFISWKEIRKIGIYAYNLNTKKIKEITFSDASRTFFSSILRLYVSTENITENDLSNLNGKNVITFKFYKDFFETLVIGYNNYSSNRNNP